MNLRVGRKLCLLIFLCVMITACQKQENRVKDIAAISGGNESGFIQSTDAQNKSKDGTQGNLKELENRAVKCNVGTENYLFFEDKEEKNLSFYFSIDVSKLDIQRVDLYEEDKLLQEDIAVDKCYDNVLEITLKKYVSHFNYIRVYDSQDNCLNLYVGEHYLELYVEKDKVAAEDREYFPHNIIDTMGRERIEIIASKKQLKKYDVKVVLPKKAEKLFNCDLSIKNKGKKKKKILYDFKLKEKYKKLTQITFEAMMMQKEKSTGIECVLNTTYIPMMKANE